MGAKSGEHGLEKSDSDLIQEQNLEIIRRLRKRRWGRTYPASHRGPGVHLSNCNFCGVDNQQHPEFCHLDELIRALELGASARIELLNLGKANDLAKQAMEDYKPPTKDDIGRVVGDAVPVRLLQKAWYGEVMPIEKAIEIMKLRMAYHVSGSDESIEAFWVIHSRLMGESK